jgi:hypothetical protein
VSSFGFSGSSELVSHKEGVVNGNSSLVDRLLVLVFDDMAFDGLVMGGKKARAVSAAPANTSKEAIVVFWNISALKITWISS